LWTQCEDGNAENARVIAEYGLNAKPGRWAPGLGRNCIHYGYNSGYQAVNLAYLLGAKRVILLGFDMHVTKDKTHFFGDHPEPMHSASPFPQFIKEFGQLAADLKAEGVTVVNCTRETALGCFTRAAL